MLNLSALKSPLLRAVLALSLAILLLSSNALPPASAAAGDLDPTFGSSGKVLSPGLRQLFNLTIQGDGRIVAVGTGGSPDDNFILGRYQPDGSLDSSFGSGGKVTTDFTSFGRNERAYDVAIQSDGKIIAAGVAENSSKFFEDFALVRYNTDGSLDTSFGVDGKVLTDFANNLDQVSAVLIQPDGRIIAVGSARGDVIGLDVALALQQRRQP